MLGAADRATTLEVKMMDAPRDRYGTACLASRKAPRTCTASDSSKESSGYWAIGPVAPLIPALAITTSRWPNRSTAASTASLTCAELVTSVTCQAAWPPSSAAPALRSGAEMPARKMLAPSAANARAVAIPMEPSPPVMIAVLPISRPMPRMLQLRATSGRAPSCDGGFASGAHRGRVYALAGAIRGYWGRPSGDASSIALYGWRTAWRRFRVTGCHATPLAGRHLRGFRDLGDPGRGAQHRPRAPALGRDGGGRLRAGASRRAFAQAHASH